MDKAFCIPLILCGFVALTSCSKTTAVEPSVNNNNDTTTHTKKAIVKIASLLPNPKGEDDYHESFTLKNSGDADGDLMGWKIMDDENTTWKLTGALPAGSETTIVSSITAKLQNNGDVVRLINDKGETVQTVTFGKVADGEVIVP